MKRKESQTTFKAKRSYSETLLNRKYEHLEKQKISDELGNYSYIYPDYTK